MKHGRSPFSADTGTGVVAIWNIVGVLLLWCGDNHKTVVDWTGDLGTPMVSIRSIIVCCDDLVKLARLVCQQLGNLLLSALVW